MALIRTTNKKHSLLYLFSMTTSLIRGHLMTFKSDYLCQKTKKKERNVKLNEIFSSDLLTKKRICSFYYRGGTYVPRSILHQGCPNQVSQ